MGIVRKQSIIGSVFIYIGALLGFITGGLLFPRNLMAEEIGLISLLVTYGVLFAQLASLGFLHTITRLFPYFRDKEQEHNGFLFLALAVSLVGCCCMVIVYYVTEPLLLSNSAQENSLFTEYVFLIVPLFIFITFFNIIDSYTKALFNATRGIIQREVVLRILILSAFFMYLYQVVSFEWFVYIYVLSYAVILFYMILRLMQEGELYLRPRSHKLTPDMIREIKQVSIYGMLISAASFIILNIDRIMIEKLVLHEPLAQVGIYTTCSFFATLVILPSRPLLKITSIIVAEAWKERNMPLLAEVYEKSSVHQFIIGVLIFIGLLVNMDSIFIILPEVFSQGFWVIIWIGLFYVCEMIAGANSLIIGNSPQYRVLSHITLGFIMLLIGLNLYFIPQYGITGAAFASFLAKSIYICVTFLYVKKRFKLQPYSSKHIKIIGVGCIACVVAFVIPQSENLFLAIVIKSSVVALVYVGLLVPLRISEDISELIAAGRKRLKL